VDAAFQVQRELAPAGRLGGGIRVRGGRL
jgi:hypothetical protein